MTAGALHHVDAVVASAGRRVGRCCSRTGIRTPVATEVELVARS